MFVAFQHRKPDRRLVTVAFLAGVLATGAAMAEEPQWPQREPVAIGGVYRAENLVTGEMAEKPASILLHLAPGDVIDVQFEDRSRRRAYVFSGSLVDTAVDWIPGLDSSDLSFTLYENTFEIGSPIKLMSLVDSTFALGGFSEVDGSDLSLTATPPTGFRVVTVADDPTITEGQDVLVTGTIFDPVGGASDGSDTYSLVIGWKVGTTQTVTLDSNTTASVAGVTFDPLKRVFSATHYYVNNVNTQAISFTATRTTGDMPTDNTTVSVQVSNVAPVVSVDPLGMDVDSNGAATLTGSYSDVGVTDTHRAVIEWGDETRSVFDIPAIGSLSVGQAIPGNFYEMGVPDGPDALTITSVDLATGQVGFQVTGKSYTMGGIAPGVEAGMTVRDSDNGMGYVYNSIYVPWDADLTVSQTTSTINENGPVELAVSFAAPAYSNGTVQCSVDWDDPNDSQASTFDFSLNPSEGNNLIGREFFAQERKFADKGIGFNGQLGLPNAILTVTSVEPIAGTDYVRVTMALDRSFLDGTLFPYVDDGPAGGNGTASDTSNVQVQISLSGGAAGIAALPLTVYDVAPTLTLDGSTDFVGPSGLTMLTGTISDIGRYDGHELRVNWGDGSTFDNDNDSSTANDTFELFTFDPVPLGSNPPRTMDTTPVVAPQYGTLTLNAGGTYSYTHDGTENFTDSFTYTVRDDTGHWASTTVPIFILPLDGSGGDPTIPDLDEVVIVIQGGTSGQGGSTLMHEPANHLTNRDFMIPHVYTQDLNGGSHTVTATVFDDDGMSATSTRNVYVHGSSAESVG